MYIHPNEGKENEDLEVYIIESGEEYYVHIYIWRVMPFHFKLDADIEVVDLTVKKIVSYEDGNCNARDDYDYIGENFVNFIKLWQLVRRLSLFL